MKKYLAYIVGIIALIALPTFFVSSTSASENIDTTVNVEPSLTLSVSANTLNLNLDPSSTTFGYNDLDVTVGTNNATGYKLTMSTTSGNTNLVNTEDNTKVIETLPTLSGGYTDSTFIANKWGYKKNRDTDNYNSFPATQTLLENSTRTNEDVANLRFATKIDYLQESGTYATSISFSAVANPLVTYIQDFTPAMCQELASSADYTVVDKRDNNDYAVRYINGNCWMTQNLRYQGDSVGSTSTTTSWIMKSDTSNISADKTMSMTDLTTGNTYNAARYHDSGNTTTGIWYNYAAASAMSIIGSPNSIEATESVCPTGWRLPSSSEFNKILSYASIFNPITDGNYWGGTLNNPDQGVWWSSTAVNGINRYALVYRNNSLSVSYFGDDYRYGGHYVRCIAN